jgi:hypothetical protein
VDSNPASLALWSNVPNHWATSSYLQSEEKLHLQSKEELVDHGTDAPVVERVHVAEAGDHLRGLVAQRAAVALEVLPWGAAHRVMEIRLGGKSKVVTSLSEK